MPRVLVTGIVALLAVLPLVWAAAQVAYLERLTGPVTPLETWLRTKGSSTVSELCTVAAASAIVLTYFLGRRQDAGRSERRAALLTALVMIILLLSLGGSGVVNELWHEREGALSKACLTHMEQLTRSLEAYVERSGGRLPEAGHWSDALRKLVGRDAFGCPVARNQTCSYAFNNHISGEPLEELVGDKYVVVIFESDRGWNATGDARLLPQLPRHFSDTDHYVVLFEGGGLGVISEHRNFPSELVWDPPQ